MSIGIIDYGMGNLQSVSNALNYLGSDNFISSSIEELSKADKLILPGVGAFGDAMYNLKEKGLDKFVIEAIESGTKLLGICLGMQLLFEKSYEYGEHDGLGILKGEIVPFRTDLKVPHMGWNSLDLIADKPLFKEIGRQPYVYFVHSYHLETTEDIVSATTPYGKNIQVAVQKENVYALQFHPEKSGKTGLTILKNFVNL